MTEHNMISAKSILRKATIEEVGAVTLILRQAAQQMMDEGKKQWDYSYPTEIHVRADIANDYGYVLVYDDEIVGYCAIVFDGEPVYNNIKGAWLSDGPYVVVHRMGIRQDRRGLGLGRAFMEKVENYAKKMGCSSFRIDTNFDNYSMLGLLDRLGFSYCGEIYYEGGSRKAFQKTLD